MTAPGDPVRFDAMYRDGRTPWDIGGPQPAVQQLVALGAVRGEVLDPGTGPGHHAIFFASKGLSATGIDASPTAIERAKENAARAVVSVDFVVADATVLDGLAGRFDTVVDSSFYHLLDEDAQQSYLGALRKATTPDARLYIFAFAPHTVNGFAIPPSVPEENFRRLLPVSGWDITYLGTTTHQIELSIESFEAMCAQNPDLADRLQPMLDRRRVMEPWLIGGRMHAPFWEVHASRLD